VNTETQGYELKLLLCEKKEMMEWWEKFN